MCVQRASEIRFGIKLPHLVKKHNGHEAKNKKSISSDARKKLCAVHARRSGCITSEKVFESMAEVS